MAVISLTTRQENHFDRLDKHRGPDQPTSASQHCNWRRHAIVLTPIMMVYLVLAFYQIDHQSLWTDEVISINRASPDASIWRRFYSQSPLYFTLLGIWSPIVGNTEFALRSLSALLGIAAVVLIYVIGQRLYNRKTAILAALILATSPYLIWYAQEIRYITLLIVMSLLMTYSFYRAISDGVWRWWLCYGAASIMGLLSFITVVFLILAHGVYLLCRASYRPTLRHWIACQLVVLLVFSGLVGIRLTREFTATVKTAPSIGSQEQPRSRTMLPLSDVLGTLPYTFYAFSVGFSLGPSLRELHTSRSLSGFITHGASVVPVAILFAALFLVGLARMRQNRDAGMFLLLWIAIPILGTFLVATLTTYHVYNTRYVAMALPAYVLILAMGIGTFRKRVVQLGVLASVLLVNGVALSNYYFNAEYGREDTRSTARYLETSARPGDIILAVGHPRALRYYYKQEVPIKVINARGRDRVVVAQNLREVTEGYHRIWLVEIRPWQRDPRGQIRAMLDNLAQFEDQKAFPGVAVYLYLADEAVLGGSDPSKAAVASR